MYVPVYYLLRQILPREIREVDFRRIDVFQFIYQVVPHLNGNCNLLQLKNTILERLAEWPALSGISDLISETTRRLFRLQGRDKSAFISTYVCTSTSNQLKCPTAVSLGTLFRKLYSN